MVVRDALGVEAPARPACLLLFLLRLRTSFQSALELPNTIDFGLSPQPNRKTTHFDSLWSLNSAARNPLLEGLAGYANLLCRFACRVGLRCHPLQCMHL